MNKKHFIIALIMLLAALSRLIPHPPNFTPQIAIALFSGFYAADKVLIYGLPIATMLISDLFLGFYRTSIFVYLSFLLISFFGTLLKLPVLPFIICVSALHFRPVGHYKNQIFEFYMKNEKKRCNIDQFSSKIVFQLSALYKYVS